MDKTVLIVEDDMLLAMLLTTNLDAMGYSVVGNVSSPSLAVALAGELRPGAVLMAISMDDGADALGAAEYISGRLGIPVVLLSVLLDHKLLHLADKVASGRILSKPYDDYDLQHILDCIFKQRPVRFSMNGVI